MPDVPLRVIKLGGSLLDVPNLAERFRRWLSSQPAADNLVIVGGGQFADVIRQMDRVHQLNEEQAHWLCIHALDLTARLVADLLPDSALTDWFEEDEERQPLRLRILQPSRMLRAYDGLAGERPLPHHWDVTSDSIAAWFAYAFHARELVLLKSRSVLSDNKKRIDEQIVDPYFKVVAGGLETIRSVNLRDPDFAESKLWC